MLTRRGGCPHPPASFLPVPDSRRPGGHKGRPYAEARSAREQAGRCGQKVNCPRGAREAALGRRPLRVHDQNRSDSGAPQPVAALPKRVQRRHFQVWGESAGGRQAKHRCAPLPYSPMGVRGRSPGGFLPLFAGEKGPGGTMTSPSLRRATWKKRHPRPGGRPQGPPLQSAAACRCSLRSMLTRRGGACPRPPLSSPPQTPAVRAAMRAAPTENGWLPLLPRSTLTRRGGCPHPPASFVPASGFGRAATRSAPTCVPARILLYSNQLFHTGGVFCGIHPPVRRSAGLCRPAAPADAHARP